MTRLFLTLTLLLLPLGQLNAQDLAGRWSVEGQDARGSYSGTVELFADGDDYRLARSVRGEEIRGALSAGATQRQVEVQKGGVKAYKNRLLVGRKKAVIPRRTVLRVLKQRLRAFQVSYQGKTLWVSKKKVHELPARVEYRASLERKVGAAGAVEVALGGSRASGAQTATFWALEHGLLEGAWEDAGQERWVRLDRAAGTPAPLRFVLAGTDLPIANSTVTIGLLQDDGSFEALERVRTDDDGVADVSLEREGDVHVVFSTRPDALTRRPEQVDTFDASVLSTHYSTVGLHYYGPSWKRLYERMLGVNDIVGSGKFSWNATNRGWDTPILDCITTALFASVAATDLGARGLYHAPLLDNMVKTPDGRSMVASSPSLRNILTPAFGTRDTMAALAKSGSVYRGVCRWPWKDMEWGWVGETACGCGAHITPATIVKNRDQLGRLNILSMSQAKRPKGPDHGPMSGWTMRYEYSVLLLIKRADGSLYTYHATSSHDPESRCKTFKGEVEHWASDSFGSRETDVRYLVWRVDDAQIDPLFWLDEAGREFTPEHLAESVLKDMQAVLSE